jgi:GAF domain-containing protein
LEQQTATSEVLEVISRSAFDLPAVFETVVESSARLCAADRALIHRFDGELLRVSATFNTSPAEKDWLEQHPIRLGTDTGAGRAALERRTIHNPDILADPAQTLVAKHKEAAGTVLSVRSILWAPILKGDHLLGVISLWHAQVKPFTDKQIAVVETFADQAAIAIENARLFEAEQERTRELTESLAQQTATSEVLGVISSSPGDLQPVFASMLENAVRICDARFGNIYTVDGDTSSLVASHNTPPAFADYRRRSPISAGTAASGRMLTTKAIIHVADLAASQPYIERSNPDTVAAVELGGARTFLAVPMFKENELIGALALSRQEVRPFTDKQIDLVKNFAAQAVIAIENARLLSELRESLAQQTATSDVLRVISSSPGELEPVFQAMLVNAAHICEAKFGNLYLSEGTAFRLVAAHNTPPAFVEARKSRPSPWHPDPKSVPGRVAITKEIVHVADLATEPRNPDSIAAVELGGIRTVVAVPMLKEGELVGYIAVYRQEVRPFSDKQIALLQNFAAQAVIAIENARLLTELRESLEQQTATAQVLQVISSSPGELQPVFSSMLENAIRICDAQFGILFRFDGEGFRIAADVGSPALGDFLRQRGSFQPTPGGPLSRVLQTKQPSYTNDHAAEAPSSPAVTLGGARSTVDVPMLKDGELVGAISIYRKEVRPFSEKQRELLTNFAAQAVIAIENARLLNELRESLDQQTATAEVLGVINASRGDLQPVFEAMVEKARLLCEADAGHLALPVGDDYRSVAVSAMSPEMTELIQSISYAPGRGTAIGRALAERRPVQISDIGADNEHIGRQAAHKGFIRTILGVPLLRQGEAIGAFGLSRQRVEPFNNRQIDLVRTFADQAVIAITGAHRRACPFGRGVACAGRDLASRQFDARSGDGAEHHREQGGAAFRHRGRRNLCLRRGAARIPPARDLWHGSSFDRRTRQCPYPR